MPGSSCGGTAVRVAGRSRRTIVRDVRAIRGFLADAGRRYSTLRQVTRDDITTWLASLRGHTRAQDASTLRSLFGILKAERLIFANPVRGVRVSRRNPSVPAPLPARLVTAAAAAARNDPALRVAVALAGVHALLPGQIRHLRLDQVDLPGRRLDPGGLDRPLDEVTATAITSYLGFRNQRWPSTANPYLLITRKTAHTGEPASWFWMSRLFRRLPVTAAQLRDDRIVEEALAGRADPLHLAAVFGFGPRTRAPLRPGRRATPPNPATHTPPRRHRIREFPGSGPSELLNSRKTGAGAFYCEPGLGGAA